MYIRTVAAPCATLGPSTSLSNSQLFTVRASPVGGKNAFIVPSALPDPRNYGDTYGLQVCSWTAACSQYSPDGGYDAVLASSDLTSKWPSDWKYADPSETVTLVATGECWAILCINAVASIVTRGKPDGVTPACTSEYVG